jgi:hypothetical protein
MNRAGIGVAQFGRYPTLNGRERRVPPHLIVHRSEGVF